MEGSNLGAGCRVLPAELSCHGWTWGRTLSLLLLLVRRALQVDERARPTPWEGIRDLPIAPASSLLPLLAVEPASSSKIMKTDSCWELGLMKRAHGSLLKCKSGSGTASRGAAGNAEPPVVSYVSFELLSIPPTAFSPHQSDSAEGLLVYLPLQSCLFPIWMWR